MWRFPIDRTRMATAAGYKRTNGSEAPEWGAVVSKRGLELDFLHRSIRFSNAYQHCVNFPSTFIEISFPLRTFFFFQYR